jgi:hypothetical protein
MNQRQHPDEELVGLIRRGFSRYEPSATALPVAMRRGFRVHLAPVVGIPVAAGLVAVLLYTQLARPPSAFASWSAVPVAADPGFAAALLASCNHPISSDTPDRDRSFLEEVNRLPMVLVDQRGSSGVALFAERRATGIASNLCLGAHDGSGTLTTAGGGASLDAQEQPATGDLRSVGSLTIWSYGGETLTAASGTSAATVAKVVVSRASGGDVTATVKDDYWVAWWPGTAAAQRITAFGADGSEITTIAP